MTYLLEGQEIMAVDKTQATIEYLLMCPKVADSALYFNFINATDEDKQFITEANEKTLNTPYIDGSVDKRFTLTIIDYRSIAYQEMARYQITANESVEEYLDVQSLIQWIEEQQDLKNFPNFGPDCVVERIGTATENPRLNGVDTQANPVLAKYSISIQIDYLDKSKMLWNN